MNIAAIMRFLYKNFRFHTFEAWQLCNLFLIHSCQNPCCSQYQSRPATCCDSSCFCVAEFSNFRTCLILNIVYQCEFACSGSDSIHYFFVHQTSRHKSIGPGSINERANTKFLKKISFSRRGCNGRSH